MPLTQFHPAVRSWFESSFPSPSPVQAKAWPAIAAGKHTLVAAPTGSGKTLTAFLWAIDELVREGLDGRLEDKTSVLYISPLKALSNDIERNLQLPLRGIREELKVRGLAAPELHVMVRTGDTKSGVRTAMTKRPPHIVVTTPESLYILLTSKGGRRMLSTVRTVIVDEVHAIIQSKRGSHFSLSMERLDRILRRPATRIGLSATQKPIDLVAKFLVGNKNMKSSGEADCTIIDTGHKRLMDIALEMPSSPLQAVMPNEIWGEVYEQLVTLIQDHKTTLIFVNTRRMCERLSFNLRERLGEEAVGAHHGSLSREQRFESEQNLKEGRYKALVATASLELGIDIGDVDLVCQIGMTKSIAAFLQRVGRSGHQVDGIPKGRLFPLTRDELVESVALFDAVRRGELDKIIMPEGPLDILAQQIVAEVAADEGVFNLGDEGTDGGMHEDMLYGMIKGAYPYRDVDRSTFNEVVKMLADGFTTRRGKRGAHIHRDIITNRLRPKKGARLQAILNGGAIPDNFDYDVIAEPENIFVGSINEDYAIESHPGDVFKLGNNNWRVLRVEEGKVRVADAHDEPPNLPFWLGEAPGRTQEMSIAVARLRQEVADRIHELPDHMEDGEVWKEPALEWLIKEVGVDLVSADQVVTYLGTGMAALGAMPTRDRLVMERFFDQVGDMHLVIHAPFGARMNRAWGLALRKRFCRNFNFELQAAATEDAIVLSLSSTHSFPLEEVFKYLNPRTVREVLVQALLDAPMFEVRWRWNASRALAITRRWTDRRVPAQIQRMQSEDLVALVFPDQLACLEHIVGDRDVPEHPLVKQSIHDCLTEAMDIDELEAMLADLHADKKELISRDMREASPFAHEIINARPYAFLDPAPLEERRTRAIRTRHVLDPAQAKEMGRLEPEAIRRVKEEAFPQVSDVDEMYDVLVQCGLFTAEEGTDHGWNGFFEVLEKQGRAIVVSSSGVQIATKLWAALERLAQLREVYSDLQGADHIELHESLETAHDLQDPLLDLMKGRLEVEGPTSVPELAEKFAIEPIALDKIMLKLEADGMVFRGTFDLDAEVQEQWCERRLLARIHRYTLQKLRREVEPVSPAAFMRFLFHWHGIGTGAANDGPQALLAVIERMQGVEAPAVAWESVLLPDRMEGYSPEVLDQLCFSGQVVWGRTLRPALEESVSSVRIAPMSLMLRKDMDHFLAPREEVQQGVLSHEAQRVLETLQQRGAIFHRDIVEHAGQLPVQSENGLSELVARGLVSADGFAGLRALLAPESMRRRRKAPFTLEQAGRWWLMPNKKDEEQDVFAIAKIMLQRYGVVFRKLAQRERCCPPWRVLVKALRRMEDRGEVRGGRFVSGVWGEQFTLPGAIPLLRAQHKEDRQPQSITISAADPLNLTGILTPGERITSRHGDRILYQDGKPAAVEESGTLRWLDVSRAAKEDVNALRGQLRRELPVKLSAYYRKGIG